MESLTHGVGRARASGIAIVTVLAMLIAPFCASRCARLHDCDAGSRIAQSGPQDCHGAASGSSDCGTSYSISEKACNRQELPVAILSAPEKSPSLHETPTFVLRLQVAKPIIPVGFDNSGYRARWRGTGDPPRAELLEITAAILRI